MKILAIIESLGKGGAERVLVSTILGLQQLNIECEVAILFENDDLASELEAQGIKIHRLHLTYKWNIFEGIFKLHTLQKNNNYDIIHAHLFFAYFYTGLAKLLTPKVKTITTFHNLGYSEYPANSWIKKIRKKIDHLIIKKYFDKTTAVSTAVKKHYEKHFNLNSIDVIFNSFPINEIEKYKKNNTLKYSNKIKKNSFVILTPGRFVNAKGHKYLIEAIDILNKEYSNFIFIFIGKGPLEKTIKESIPENVELMSEIPHSDLMAIYKEVDLIVIPSVYEAFGLVVGEAMIMGKGIVATEVDGIVEMIKDNVEGLLVPHKDSKALAHAISTLFTDTHLRKTLAKNAKEKIKQFDTKIIAQEWKVYYEEMLN